MLSIWTSLKFCYLPNFLPFSSDLKMSSANSFSLEESKICRLEMGSADEFADDIFKSDENGRKLSKQVEYTVGKGEIARYEQFLLFPQCFQKACFPEVSKGVIVREWVNWGYSSTPNNRQVFLKQGYAAFNSVSVKTEFTSSFIKQHLPNLTANTLKTTIYKIVSQTLKFVLRKVENIVRKRQNAGNSIFLLFSQCFQN